MKTIIIVTLITFALSSSVDFVVGIAERVITGEKANSGLTAIAFVEFLLAIVSLVFMAYV